MTQDELKQAVAQAALKYSQEGIIGVGSGSTVNFFIDALATVKGRIDGADSVMVTRQEGITSLHEPGKFILAIVSVTGGFAHEPRYVHGPLVDREPSFLETAIQFDLRRLIERADKPG